MVNPAFLSFYFNASFLIFHLTPSFPPPSSPPSTPPTLPACCARCYQCVVVLQALAQAIKEAKEQHPDMSVTRVVVHKETELAEEED